VATATDSPAKTDTKAPIIVDLGKQRRKNVKDLRSGTGRLAEALNGCLEELRTAGTLASNSQTVVVIVRQRRRRNKSLKSLIPGL
jgi:hypothetical protein